MKGKKREEMGLADVRASLYARILLAVADRVAIGHFSGPAGFSNPYHRGETLALTWIEKGTQCGWMGRPGSGEAPGPITEELLGGGTLELHLGGITDAIAFFEPAEPFPQGWVDGGVCFVDADVEAPCENKGVPRFCEIDAGHF